MEQHLESVFELEKQIQSTTQSGCTVPGAPTKGPNMHGKFKQMIDLGLLALTCDLTRVLALQYSNSWGLDFAGYDLPDGVGDWSDHFISHKLGDRDRATDLDGLPQAEAMRIANARVVQTSRFKVRRFAYLLNAMKAAQTATGNLLDESLVLYTSENGDGDSHGRTNMPIMLAGHVGGSRQAAPSRPASRRPARFTAPSSTTSASSCRSTATRRAGLSPACEPRAPRGLRVTPTSARPSMGSPARGC